MASSYVGVITKQSEKSGITLRAKVTSPQGNYSATKDFKCMVKPFGLTDLQSVLKDLATISENIIAAKPMEIKSNLLPVMPKKGENDTTVRYISSISDFLNNDGVVLSRPSYGTTNKVGTLRVIVSKGQESVERIIDVCVLQYTKEEIALNAITALTWDTIRKDNAVETATVTSGLLNVTTDLTLVPELNVTGSSTPVSVAWSVEDSIKGVIGSERLSASGVVSRKAYTNIISLINSGQLSVSSYVVTAINGVPAIRLRGLKLTGTVTVGTAGNQVSLTKDFILNTMTETISNTEVANHLSGSATVNGLIPTGIGTEYTNVYYNTKTISYVGTVGTKVNLFTANEILNNTYGNLFGSDKGIIITNTTWSISDHSGSPIAEDLSPYIIGGGINFTGTTPTVEFKDLPTAEKAIAFKCTANISSYGGEAAPVQLLFKVRLLKA